MALTRNGSHQLSGLSRFHGAVGAYGLHSALDNNGKRGNFNSGEHAVSGVTRHAAIPSGYRHPIAWKMGTKAGTVTSRNDIGVTVSASGSGAMGKNMSGTAGILITPTGDIFSPLWTSGETGIALGITGQINGALWVVGESDIALQASGLLTGIGSISGVAWTILNARHVDLTGYQRAYVRSILESVYTSTETDRIIFTAARNAISVLDAAVALRINAEPLQIIAAQERKRRAPQPVVEKQAIQPKTQERKNNPAYVVATPQTTYAQSGDAPLFAISETQQLVAATASKPIFINLRTKE